MLSILVHACSLWFSDSSLGSQTFSTPFFKIMVFESELILMYWQTTRSCGKRKEVASSLFSRIHWRKPVSPFGFFRTVRIQSRGERSSIWLEWHFRKIQSLLCYQCAFVVSSSRLHVKKGHIHCLLHIHWEHQTGSSCSSWVRHMELQGQLELQGSCIKHFLGFS